MISAFPSAGFAKAVYDPQHKDPNEPDHANHEADPKYEQWEDRKFDYSKGVNGLEGETEHQHEPDDAPAEPKNDEENERPDELRLEGFVLGYGVTPLGDINTPVGVDLTA